MVGMGDSSVRRRLIPITVFTLSFLLLNLVMHKKSFVPRCLYKYM